MEKCHAAHSINNCSGYLRGSFWVINSYIPMQQTIKKILNVIVIIVVVFWLLSVFGFIGDLSTIRVGR